MLFTKHTLFHLREAKSGISTVLGMLIFIGVLFTCVVPFFLYVNQVNSIYDRTVVDMRQSDQDHEMERLDVYAFPNSTLNELYVYVKSKCALEVRVTRVWVNDTFYDESDLPAGLPLILAGVSESTIKGIGISQGYFDIYVTTARGNVFASITNTIHITGSGWEAGAYNFAIPIYVTKAGTYEVNVTDKAGFTDYVTVKAAPTGYRLLQVPKPGIYYVKVKGESEEWVRMVDWEFPTAQQIVVPTSP